MFASWRITRSPRPRPSSARPSAVRSTTVRSSPCVTRPRSSTSAGASGVAAAAASTWSSSRSRRQWPARRYRRPTSTGGLTVPSRTPPAERRAAPGTMPASWRATAAGASRCTWCPAPTTTISSATGRAAAIPRPLRGETTRSASGTTTSAGTASRGSSGVRSRPVPQMSHPGGTLPRRRRPSTTVATTSRDAPGPKPSAMKVASTTPSANPSRRRGCRVMCGAVATSPSHPTRPGTASPRSSATTPPSECPTTPVSAGHPVASSTASRNARTVAAGVSRGVRSSPWAGRSTATTATSSGRWVTSASQCRAVPPSPWRSRTVVRARSTGGPPVHSLTRRPATVRCAGLTATAPRPRGRGGGARRTSGCRRSRWP